MVTRPQRYSIAFCLALLLSSGLDSAAQTPAEGTASFRVFLNGAPLGTATSSLERTDSGWVIRGTAQVQTAAGITASEVEVTYTDRWQPRKLNLELETSAQTIVVDGQFTAGAPAQVNVITEGNTESSTPEISDRAVILPPPAYATYEALTARLTVSNVGDEFPVFLAPEGEITVRVEDVAEETISTVARTIHARRWNITFVTAEDSLPATVWTDAGRLARFDLPSETLSVARTDVAAVSTRIVSWARPNDEDVFISASGFSLAATISRPEKPPADRLPAVILVGGSAPVDRDESTGGVPVFAQLADGFADAGFLVVRFDRRGVGQSGGRIEAATLVSFAEDVRQIVRYLRDRDDVDRDRIIVVGFDEGGWVGLLAADMERRINALVLAGTPGSPGAVFEIERQRLMLADRNLTAAQREEAIALQQRIVDAVVSDEGWSDIPAAVRRQVDTSLYRSRLTFDPASVLEDLRQPVLVVHGDRDLQVRPRHADALVTVAQGRRRDEARESRLVTLPDLDHRFVRQPPPASEPASVSPEVAAAVVDWIRQVLPEN